IARPAGIVAIGRPLAVGATAVPQASDAAAEHDREHEGRQQMPGHASLGQRGSESRKSRRTRLKASGWSRFDEWPAPAITSSRAPGIFLAMYSHGARNG